MSLEHATRDHLSVRRLLIGGNPFSSFSHQTAEHIHATLRQAESLGINTILGRADAHIVGVLKT